MLKMALKNSGNYHFKEYSIKYANIQTQQYINTLQQLSIERSDWWRNDTYDLSFSPDATELLVTCNGKSIIMPVPWEISKTKACDRYLLLKHYQLDEQPLPHDVIWLLTAALRDVCEYEA